MLRTACDTVLFENNERFQPKDVVPNRDYSKIFCKGENLNIDYQPVTVIQNSSFRINSNITGNCAFVPMVEFTNDRFKYVNFVCWHDCKRHEDPIYLVSNLLRAGEIIELYG